MDLERTPFNCSAALRHSYVPVLDASQLPLQQFNPLILSEYDCSQGLHFREQFVQHVILRGGERRKGMRHGPGNNFG